MDSLVTAAARALKAGDPLGALKRIVGYGGNRPLTAAQQATINQNAGRYKTTTANDHLLTLSFTGLTDNDHTDRTSSRDGLAKATGQPLPF